MLYLPVFISIDQHMFGRWDQTMLNAAITPERLLIGTGMEKTNVLLLLFDQLGQIDIELVRL